MSFDEDDFDPWDVVSLVVSVFVIFVFCRLGELTRVPRHARIIIIRSPRKTMTAAARLEETIVKKSLVHSIHSF